MTEILEAFTIIGAGTVVAGLVVSILGVVRMIRNLRLLKDGARAQAEVVRLITRTFRRDPDPHYRPVLRFRTTHGAEVTTPSRQWFDNDMGRHATVLYDPRHPERILLQEPWDTGGRPAVIGDALGWVAGGVGIVGAGLYLLFFL